jgi:CubicO group peptidase (beta-lactamase class C family)
VASDVGRLLTVAVLSGAAVFAGLTGCGETPSPAVNGVGLEPALRQKIEDSLSDTLRSDQLPGLAIGIIRNHQLVYSRGFGQANIETGTPVTSQTIFQLGSDSKMMVGIALMQLQEQGKLDLDAPVTRYLPWFRLDDPRFEKITIRYLASHRSGLPYSIDNETNTIDYQAPQFDAGALDRHVRHAVTLKLIHEPGSVMDYSDVGFEIIGDVIAQVSGMSFEDYTRKNIFQPLGMLHTSFQLSDIPPRMLATPHLLDPNIKVNPYFPYSRQHAPSSLLLSNVDDMMRFALAQMNRGELDGVRIVDASAYKTMWHAEIPTAIESPWERNVGIGWFMGEHGKHFLVGHGGGDVGFGCGFVMAPDEGLAVIAMINRSASAEDISYKVMAMLLEDEDH